MPDKAQLPVRIRALDAGKLLYMAVPRLAEELPFYLLDPASLNSSPAEAATQAVIVTTMHELQVLDQELPEDEHDFRVDWIVTPERVIECGPAKRPGGLSWDSLAPDKIAAIPVLARMSRMRR